MRTSCFVSDPRTTSAPRRFVTLAMIVGVALARATAPGVAADVPNAVAIARDDQSFVEFTQGEPVTPAEHDRLLNEIRIELQRRPEETERADAVIHTLLLKLAALKPPDAEAMRGEIRIRFALLPDSVTERQIVENHDPSVIVDRVHGRAITARTVVVIERASQWLAKELAIAGPGNGFVKAETADIREHYSHLTDDEQEACTHVARNMAAGMDFVATLSPEQRATRRAKVRAALGNSEHPVPIDALAVFAMARAYSEAHAENAFLATTRAMFHLQDLNGLVMGLQGEHQAFISGPH